MKIDIFNRYTGRIKFTAEIDYEVKSRSLQMGMAVPWGIKNNADLRNADLRTADLRNAHLSNADLRNADLSNADLRNAHLSNADLRTADLRNVDLSTADLRNADLRNAHLSNADLRTAHLSNADLRNADLSNAELCLGRNKGNRVVSMSHLPYFILGYVAIRKGKLAMCLEIGCEKHTVQTFERKYKNGDFSHESKFIEIAMPYIAAIKADLRKIKAKVE